MATGIIIIGYFDDLALLNRVRPSAQVQVLITMNVCLRPNFLNGPMPTHVNQLSVSGDVPAIRQDITGDQIVLHNPFNFEDGSLLIISDLTSQVFVLVGINPCRRNDRNVLVQSSIINWTDISPIARDVAGLARRLR